MKRAIWIGALALLAFALILLVRMPASWFAGALPSDIGCAQITGTVWTGACSALTVRNAALGDLKWQLHPGPLLAGKLSSQLELNAPAGSATAEIEARSGGRLTAHNLRASFALDPKLLPQVPANLRGKVQTDLSRVRIENGRIAALEGRIDVRDLEQHGAEKRVLGDYVLTFPAVRARSRDGEPVGDLRSVKGPLDIEGTLRLTREPGFEIEGLIAAGPNAPPELLQQLGYLGTPDSRGRRSFSMAGSF